YLSFSKQVALLIYSLVGFLICISIMNSIVNEREEIVSGAAGSSQGWLIIIGSTIVYIALCFLIHKYLLPKLQFNKLNNKRYLNTLIPGLSLLLGIILAFLFIVSDIFKKVLPTELFERISRINLSENSVLH